MPRLSTKKTIENQTIEKDGLPFSKDCFVNGFPLQNESGDDIPMWWSAVRETGVSFKQYKKDKKRAEKEIAGLEEYLKKLEEENKRYTEKLKKESEKYRLECDMRNHAFEERRRQEEIILATEKEEAKKRVLEEKLQIQARKFEQQKENSLLEEKSREEEAQLRYRESLARIQAVEKAGREKVLDEEGVKKGSIQKVSKLQKMLDGKKRIELENAVERGTVKKLRRSHKAKDYEFLYPRPSFGVKNNDTLIEFSALCTKNKKNLKHLSSPIYAEIGKGVTISNELSKREMKAVCIALSRQVPKDTLLSGGVRYKSNFLLHELTKKKQLELTAGNVNIVSEENVDLSGFKSVGTYLREKVGEEKIEIATDYLQRLNVRSVKNLMKKRAFSCSMTDIRKVILVCALLTGAEITVLCEPQRLFDSPTENAFWQIVSEWQGGKDGKVLWVLSSSEEFRK